MRNRNGNRAFTLAVCALSTFNILYADEYIISYRSVVSDATLTHETLTVSRAMQKCSGTPRHSILLDTQDSANLHQILLRGFDDFFALMQKEKLHIRHSEKTINGVNSAQTVVTLPPHCFTVDFNQGLVKISALN
ncbi:MAG: hypothetical protein U9Q62_05535 [Campylobacterota bacterium]|nr:hypothetical protein [Campylobacterota bacterium]